MPIAGRRPASERRRFFHPREQVCDDGIVCGLAEKRPRRKQRPGANSRYNVELRPYARFCPTDQHPGAKCALGTTAGDFEDVEAPMMQVLQCRNEALDGETFAELGVLVGIQWIAAI